MFDRSGFVVLGFAAACSAAPSFAPEAPAASADRASRLRLEVSTPVPGDLMRFYVWGAPGTTVSVLASLKTGRTCDALGCYDLRSAVVVAQGTVPTGGLFTPTVEVPMALVAGTDVAFQVRSSTGSISPTRIGTSSFPLAISGAWDDGFGGTRDISSFAWFDFGTFDILSFDNRGKQVLALNSPDTFFPGTFSRFDWHTDGARVFYCQTAYNAVSPGAALALPPADTTDPTTGGCGGAFPGGFSWTEIFPASLDLNGTWTDEWGTPHQISDDTWTQFSDVWHITRFSDARRFVVAQNDASNSFFPGLWSRFDWAVDGADVYYCQTAYAASTEASAAYATPADPTEPSTGGCGGAWPGGFPWTLLGSLP